MAKIVAEMVAYKSFIAALCKYHYSKYKLADITGLSHVTICRWISTAHQHPDNIVYIAKWERSATTGPYTAFWAFGYRMEDAIKPSPMTRKEKNDKARRAFRITQTSTGVIHVSS